MIDAKRQASSLANRAGAALPLEHYLVVRHGNPIDFFEHILALPQAAFLAQVGIGPPLAAPILADLLLVSFAIALRGCLDLLLVAFAVAARVRTVPFQPLQILIALSGRPVAKRKHLTAVPEMQAAGIVRPRRRDAKTCRFAAPGRRHAKTQTHLVI